MSDEKEEGARKRKPLSEEQRQLKKIHRKQYYLQHREILLAKSRKYFLEHHDKKYAAERRYQERHRERIKERSRQRSRRRGDGYAILGHGRTWPPYSLKMRVINEVALQAGCAVCGYNETHAGMCWHHLRDKRFSFNRPRICPIPWADIIEEMGRCVVLCHNCHSAVHNPKNGFITPRRRARIEEIRAQSSKSPPPSLPPTISLTSLSVAPGSDSTPLSCVLVPAHPEPVQLQFAFQDPQSDPTDEPSPDNAG